MVRSLLAQLIVVREEVGVVEADRNGFCEMKMVQRVSLGVSCVFEINVKL